jgi:hypothetical protein
MKASLDLDFALMERNPFFALYAGTLSANVLPTINKEDAFSKNICKRFCDDTSGQARANNTIIMLYKINAPVRTIFF